MTKTELKQNITKINKLLRSDSYEAGIELIKTLDDPEITKGTLKEHLKKYLVKNKGTPPEQMSRQSWENSNKKTPKA